MTLLKTSLNDADAVTKKYVDESLSHNVESLKERLEEISTERKYRPIIIATASYMYQGDLTKGNYDFNFSRDSKRRFSKHNVFNGFVMPQCGYIKRFVLEDTGYRIYFNEDLPLITILENNPEKYNPLPIFSLVVIRNNSIMDEPTIEITEIVEIGTLNIHLKPYYIGSNDVVIAGYSFTSNIVGGANKYKLNAKDILNVRSEISTFEGKEINTATISRKGVIA